MSEIHSLAHQHVPCGRVQLDFCYKDDFAYHPEPGLGDGALDVKKSQINEWVDQFMAEQQGEV
jgi:hypothetical protein